MGPIETWRGQMGPFKIITLHNRTLTDQLANETYNKQTAAFISNMHLSTYTLLTVSLNQLLLFVVQRGWILELVVRAALYMLSVYTRRSCVA